ncbi:Ppx/GppA phosphatase family protein [Nafulsella turpanensis]|uniref:Ppx/GppA phosphatase family protein n=1 Tax=Nafulsella turpanensis TaxID=1265690 RepID=UPI0012685ABE|nr:exopolyphosphatase [Nafulsella turpanensis]
MRKIAVIDLGTNTFHILIARVEADKVEILHREKVAVKIGEGGINAQVIIEEAQARAISALRHFKAVADEYGVTEIYATATSAIRNASNREAITDRIFQETGIRVKVISGEEEAELIYGGVKQAMRLPQSNSLIMDIGGGSVEFIIADENQSYYKQSFEIGAQRLLDLFHHHDPILPEEVERLEQYLQEQLRPLTEAVMRLKPVTLIGSSGSFDTLSDIYCNILQLERDPAATEYPLTLESFFSIYHDLLAKSRQQRLETPGMIPLRVDMIVVACCLIRFVVEEYQLTDIRVSSYALKEGLLQRVIQLQRVDFHS